MHIVYEFSTNTDPDPDAVIKAENARAQKTVTLLEIASEAEFFPSGPDIAQLRYLHLTETTPERVPPFQHSLPRLLLFKRETVTGKRYSASRRCRL